MTTYTIGKIAKASGSSVETIRYYEREGLLPEAPRSDSGYRQYSQTAISRLRFIRRAKQLGFTLDEVRSLLKLADVDGSKAEVKALTEQKLALIDQKIDQLKAMRDALGELNDQCDGRGAISHCPIIHALENDHDHHNCHST